MKTLSRVFSGCTAIGARLLAAQGLRADAWRELLRPDPSARHREPAASGELLFGPGCPGERHRGQQSILGHCAAAGTCRRHRGGDHSRLDVASDETFRVVGQGP